MPPRCRPDTKRPAAIGRRPVVLVAGQQQDGNVDAAVELRAAAGIVGDARRQPALAARNFCAERMHRRAAVAVADDADLTLHHVGPRREIVERAQRCRPRACWASPRPASCTPPWCRAARTNRAPARDSPDSPAALPQPSVCGFVPGAAMRQDDRREWSVA